MGEHKKSSNTYQDNNKIGTSFYYYLNFGVGTINPKLNCNFGVGILIVLRNFNFGVLWLKDLWITT